MGAARAQDLARCAIPPRIAERIATSASSDDPIAVLSRHGEIANVASGVLCCLALWQLRDQRLEPEMREERAYAVARGLDLGFQHHVSMASSEAVKQALTHWRGCTRKPAALAGVILGALDPLRRARLTLDEVSQLG